MKPEKVGNYQSNFLPFKSCCRRYLPKNKIFNGQTVKTYTTILRDDFDWENLIKYIKYEFKDKEKINILSLASSDGSEAYSLAILIKELIPEFERKIFPIIASDIDGEIINCAKTGRMNLYSIEFLNAERNYNIDLSKYFNDKSASVSIKGDDYSDTDLISSYKINEDLLKTVKFKQSDILTELNNLEDDGNTIILCRNVFPYLEENYADKVISAAEKKLKRGSLFIIGDFDQTTDIQYKLETYGFYKPIINNQNLFRRGSVSEILDKLNAGYII